MDQLKSLIAENKQKKSFNRGERISEEEKQEEIRRENKKRLESEKIEKREEMMRIAAEKKRAKRKKLNESSSPSEPPSKPSPPPSLSPGDLAILGWIDKIFANWEKISSDPIIEKTKMQISPLIRKIKSGTLQSDISEKLNSIIVNSENREYRAAHDAYILLAIGNAAWPLGGLMKGLINARSEAVANAHILNDDTTRLYMQAFKRLMSKCQEIFPAENPSDMIQF